MSATERNHPFTFMEYAPGKYRAKLNEYFSYHIEEIKEEGFTVYFEYKNDCVVEIIPEKEGCFESAVEICRYHYNRTFSNLPVIYKPL